MNDIKDMVKVPVHVINLGAHMHVFCAALQFPLWYKTPVSDKTKGETLSWRLPARPSLRARRGRV